MTQSEFDTMVKENEHLDAEFSIFALNKVSEKRNKAKEETAAV